MKKKYNLKVKEDYVQKIKLIKKYNKYYYSESKPLVDDVTYDTYFQGKIFLANLMRIIESHKDKEDVMDAIKTVSQTGTVRFISK